MIKKVYLLFFAFFLLIASYASAADVTMQDGLSLFSNKELNTLKTELSKISYNTTIITDTNYDEDNIDTYAEHQFSELFLTDRDILLIIIMNSERNQVAIKVKRNSTIFNNVQGLAADYDNDGVNEERFKEVLDKNFVPYAKNKDFVSGVVYTIKDLERIAQNSEVTTPIKEQNSEVVIPTKEQNVVITPQNNNDSTNPFLLFIIVGVMLLISTITYFGYRLMKQKKYQSNLIQLKNEYNSMLLTTTDLHTKLENMEGLTLGKTNELVVNAKEKMMEIINIIVDSKKEVQELTVTIFSNKVQHDIQKHEIQIKQNKSTINESIELTKKIEYIEKNLTKDIEKINGDFSVIQIDFSKVKEQYKYPLTIIEEKIAQIILKMTDLEQLESFDALEAQEVANKINESLKEVKSLINDVEINNKTLSQISSTIQSTLNYITNAIENEKLLLVEKNPMSVFDSFENHLDTAKNYLILGNSTEFSKEIETITESLKKAKETIVEIIQVKKDNVKNIQDLKLQINHFKEIPKLIDIELKKLEVFQTDHYDFIYEELNLIVSLTNTIESNISNINELNADNVQKYFKCKSLIDEQMVTLNKLKEHSNKCLSHYKDLTNKMSNLRKEHSDLIQKGNGIIKKFNYENLKITSDVYSLKESLDIFEESPFNNPPFNLRAMEKHITDLNSKVNLLQKEFNSLKKEKDKAIESVNEISRTVAKIGTKVNTNSFSRNSSHMNRLIEEGRYDEAIIYAASMSSVIDQMQQEYNRIQMADSLARQRRETEERRHHSNDHHSSSSLSTSSSFSSWDSGSSSHSSSWDSGGSSDSGGGSSDF